MNIGLRLATILPRAAAIVVASMPVPLGAASLNAQYAISLAGFPIGTADVSADLGERYKVDIQARLTGLAGAITGGSGGATAGGLLTGSRPLPASYSVVSRSSSEQRTVRVGLAGGNVTQVGTVEGDVTLG